MNIDKIHYYPLYTLIKRIEKPEKVTLFTKFQFSWKQFLETSRFSNMLFFTLFLTMFWNYFFKKKSGKLEVRKAIQCNYRKVVQFKHKFIVICTEFGLYNANSYFFVLFVSVCRSPGCSDSGEDIIKIVVALEEMQNYLNMSGSQMHGCMVVNPECLTHALAQASKFIFQISS